MREWFVKHGVDPWYFKDDVLKFPESKPPAFLTLDDRCICFDGRFPTTEEMMGFVSWQKKDVSGMPVLGATGQFPDGKINPDDEGELRMAVGHDQDLVHLAFGKPVATIWLPRREAIEFAQVVMRHALALRK